MSRIDVFRNFPESKSRTDVLNERGMRKFVPKNKKSLSDSEIREKFKTHHDKKNAPFQKAKIKGQKLGESFMNPDKIQPPKQNLIAMKEAKAAEEKPEVARSDINKNDPNDTNTTEKLKGLLSTGGFSFNEKEKATLAKILNTQD